MFFLSHIIYIPIIFLDPRTTSTKIIRLPSTMITPLYSTSLPANPDVTGNDEQVFLQDDYITFLINTITAGNAAAIGGTDLKGNMTYMLAPKIRKNLQGVLTVIVGNSSDGQGEYSLCYIALDANHFFATIKDKDSSAPVIQSSVVGM